MPGRLEQFSLCMTFLLSGLTLVEVADSKIESEVEELLAWWMIEDLLIVLTTKPLSLALKILFCIPVKFLSLSLLLKKELFESNLSQGLNIRLFVPVP